MTTAALLNIMVWDDYNHGIAQLHSPFFDDEVKVKVLPDIEKGRHISDKMLAALNDFLALSDAHLPKLQQYLHQHAEMCFETTSYGFIFPEEEDEITANRRAFGVYTPEDAFKKANIDSVVIEGENDQYKNRYISLQFYPDWEDGHGCNIILQNGIPVGWQESMPHMGCYEE